MNTITTLSAGHGPISDDAGVSLACFGIDVMPLGSTPLGELVKVNINFDYADALSAEALITSISIDKPLRIGDGQFVTIFKQSAQPVVAFSAEPSHTHNQNLHKNPIKEEHLKTEIDLLRSDVVMLAEQLRQKHKQVQELLQAVQMTWGKQ